MKLILLLLIAVLLLPGMVSSSTSGYFSDVEISSGNSLTAAELVTVTLLDDGFEGTPWDANWDGNGVANWVIDNKSHSGQYAALCKKNNNGYLTSDGLDTSQAAIIIVSFWFRPHSVETGDMLVQLYNGNIYDTRYDLANYPTFQDNTWCYFSEEITDPQYFNSAFRLRFDGSGLVDGGETYSIDDVLIAIKRWP